MLWAEVRFFASLRMTRLWGRDGGRLIAARAACFYAGTQFRQGGRERPSSTADAVPLPRRGRLGTGAKPRFPKGKGLMPPYRPCAALHPRGRALSRYLFHLPHQQRFACLRGDRQGRLSAERERKERLPAFTGREPFCASVPLL